MQESHKYFQEITCQSMDHSCKCSALLHISSVTRFPTLRTLAVVREDGFLLSTWGQGAAVLGLALGEGQPPQASQSKTASHLPQLLTAQEQVLVVYARDKPRGRLGPDPGYYRSDRQKCEPNILQCQACIASALFFAGSLPSCAHGLEARKDTMLPPPTYFC